MYLLHLGNCTSSLQQLVSWFIMCVNNISVWSVIQLITLGICKPQILNECRLWKTKKSNIHENKILPHSTKINESTVFTFSLVWIPLSKADHGMLWSRPKTFNIKNWDKLFFRLLIYSRSYSYVSPFAIH